MRNPLTILKEDGSPNTGRAVEAYQYQETNPYYGDKIGDFSEVPGLGMYHIEVTDTVKATVLIDGIRQESLTGVMLDGELGATNIPNGSITTNKLADGAVTPEKTTFVESWT